MTSTANQLVTVIGGSGFLGRQVVRALARRGYRVRVAVRRPDLAGHVQPLGTPGQIMPVQANVRYPASIAASVEGADAVVNLVGILANAGPQTFDAVHVFGAEATARAAKEAGARAFVQISAIGANPHSTSAYARSKAEGEARAAAVFPHAAIIRPSIMFGPGDGFFNRFVAMSRFSPVLPLIGGGATRFQPVYVADVAEAIAIIVDGKASPGDPYELGGPTVYTFRELMEFTLETVQRKRLLVPVPFWLASMKGAVLQLLPGPLLTMDQVELLKSDNVVGETAAGQGRTLNGLAIQPEGIEGIVPSYLYRYRKAGQFTAVA